MKAPSKLLVRVTLCEGVTLVGSVPISVRISVGARQGRLGSRANEERDQAEAKAKGQGTRLKQRQSRKMGQGAPKGAIKALTKDGRRNRDGSPEGGEKAKKGDTQAEGQERLGESRANEG